MWKIVRFVYKKNSIELPSACCACLSFMFVKFYILCRYIHVSPSAAQSPLQLTYQIKFTYYVVESTLKELRQI